MAERKGEASKHLKVFQKLLFLSARKTLAESGGGAAAEPQGKVGGDIMQRTMEPTRKAGRVESVCCSAGTGSSVLDPFPSMVVASLRAVDHSICFVGD